MQFNRVRRPEWTDLAVVLGPNTDWVSAAYDDLTRFAPEVLLGYHVRLAVPLTRLEGYIIRKLVILEGFSMLDWSFIQRARIQTGMYGGKVEWYRVHRPDPIRRVA